MKTVLHTKYGPPDELRLVETEKPVPKANEVLVKIYAASVTTTDCNVRNLTFVPKSFKLMAKLAFGISKPKNNRLGFEFSGTVEAVGGNVTMFKKGDAVFGTPGEKLGTYAEYICVAENGAITKNPSNMSFEEASTVTLAANTALFFIRDLGNVKAGQKILIHGASGAIGTYAVQLAKYYGAEVTGVCSAANMALVKSLGADRVVDYTKEDFTKSGEMYDVVFSVVGKTHFKDCKKILKEKGVYLENWLEVAGIFAMLLTSITGGKKFKAGMATENIKNLIFLKELIEKGALKSVIDKKYPVKRIAEAFSYVEAGHKKGNVVVTF